MTIIFIRHGESETNINNIMSNTGYIYGLTKRGITQAETLAKELKRKYPNPMKIISSPLKRADETARIISKQFNTEYIIDERLIEFHPGVFEGKSGDNLKPLFELWEKWLTDEKTSSESPPGGESRDDVVQRLNLFLNDLLENNNENDIIFCVSHGGVLITALPNVPNIKNTEKLKHYDLLNTEIVEVLYKRKEGFMCNGFGPI